MSGSSSVVRSRGYWQCAEGTHGLERDILPVPGQPRIEGSHPPRPPVTLPAPSGHAEPRHLAACPEVELSADAAAQWSGLAAVSIGDCKRRIEQFSLYRALSRRMRAERADQQGNRAIERNATEWSCAPRSCRPRPTLCSRISRRQCVAVTLPIRRILRITQIPRGSCALHSLAVPEPSPAWSLTRLTGSTGGSWFLFRDLVPRVLCFQSSVPAPFRASSVPSCGWLIVNGGAVCARCLPSLCVSAVGNLSPMGLK